MFERFERGLFRLTLLLTSLRDWFLGTDKVYWESRKRKQEGKAEGDLVASED